jgi:hypothetical protein
MNHFAKLLNALPVGVKFIMAEEFPPACVVAFAHNGQEFSGSVDKFDGTMEFWQIAPAPRCRVPEEELATWGGIKETLAVPQHLGTV